MCFFKFLLIWMNQSEENSMSHFTAGFTLVLFGTRINITPSWEFVFRFLVSAWNFITLLCLLSSRATQFWKRRFRRITFAEFFVLWCSCWRSSYEELVTDRMLNFALVTSQMLLEGRSRFEKRGKKQQLRGREVLAVSDDRLAENWKTF